MIKAIFKTAGDTPRSYEPDIKKALHYAKGLYFYFVPQYAERAGLSFVDAIRDYERSRTLLFAQDEIPDCIGWRMPPEIQREISHTNH